MKVYRFVEKILVLGLLCLCTWTSVLAQQSGSAASVSRSRAIVNAGPNAPVPTTNTYYPTYNPPRPGFKIPEEIAVEEFVNYHKHRLPLPEWGRGLYHFISDYKDINKVFVNEVQSLISSVAKNVQVRIEYGSGLQLEKVYGYQPMYGRGDVSITLDDMNNGLTQVVMAKFRADSVRNSIPVKVRLTYFDVKRKCMVEEVQDVRLVPAESDSCELLADVEVKKNYTIAELADSLFQMAGLARGGLYSQALNTLDASVATAYRRYPNMEDEDISFILGIVEGYRRDLRTFDGQKRRHDCGGCR